MKNASLLLAGAGLLLLLASCGSSGAEPPRAAQPPRKAATANEATTQEVPYPPKDKGSLPVPAEPPPVDLEQKPTGLADEKPLTVAPEDRKAVEQMKRELAASKKALTQDADLWPSDDELLAELGAGEERDLGETAPHTRKDTGRAVAGSEKGEGLPLAGIGTVPEIYPRLTELKMVLFDFDQDTLSEAAKASLGRNIAWLRQNPAVRVRVEGHCDERGSSEYNLALGQRRANRVADYFISNGIDPGRLMAVSFGEEVPLVLGHDEDAWRQNRRVEFSHLDGPPSESVGKVLGNRLER